MSEFERIYDIEKHKTHEKPLSSLIDTPKPGYSKPNPPPLAHLTLAEIIETDQPKSKRKYTKKAKK